MTVTKSNESSQISAGSHLSVEQMNAIDILVQGRTDQETAETVGVARETVTRWRNDNPHFTAELNKQRRLIWGDSHDRLRALASKAVDTLETSLDEGDSRVALEVLKAIGLYGQVQPPSGPEDAELVLWAEAKEWAEKEFKKQRPSIDPLLAFTLGEIEIPALAQERMEELWEQCHQ
jgi:hypothetical protein